MKLSFFSTLLLVALFSISEVHAGFQVFSGGCDITPTSLSQRELQLQKELLTVKKQLDSSGKALNDLNSSLKWQKAGSIISKIADGVATVVSFFTGTSAIKNLIDTAIPALSKIFTTPSPDPASAKKGFFIFVKGQKTYVRDANEALAWIETQLDDLEQRVSASGGSDLIKSDMPFLTAKCDQSYQCPTDSDELETVLQSLAKWYFQAGGATSNSDNALVDTQIPFVKDTIRLLKLKQLYYQRLGEMLKQGTSSCASLAKS